MKTEFCASQTPGPGPRTKNLKTMYAKTLTRDQVMSTLTETDWSGDVVPLKAARDQLYPIFGVERVAAPPQGEL